MKILKYIKFVICLMLVISMALPSFAALPASDGSVFVTKAEFDSALSEFNTRLVTFESGVNSKIDSQVTSYLDRNGIWSGKKQGLNPTFSCYAKMSSTATVVTATANSFMGYGKNTSGGHYAMTYENVDPQNLIDNTSALPREAVNKSGLLCLEFDIQNTMNSKFNEPTYGGNALRIACRNDNGYPLEHDDYLGIVFIVKDDKEIEKYRYLWHRNFPTATMFRIEPTERIFSYFFVNAGDKLTVESKWFSGVDSFADWDHAGDWWQKSFVPISAYIY